MNAPSGASRFQLPLECSLASVKRLRSLPQRFNKSILSIFGTTTQSKGVLLNFAWEEEEEYLSLENGLKTRVLELLLCKCNWRGLLKTGTYRNYNQLSSFSKLKLKPNILKKKVKTVFSKFAKGNSGFIYNATFRRNKSDASQVTNYYFFRESFKGNNKLQF